MTTTHNPEHPLVAGHVDVTTTEQPVNAIGHYVFGALRIVVGFSFLWAFFDKLLGLGWSTGVNADTGVTTRFGTDAWIHGGSPTNGFLAYAAKGPFEGVYHTLAGTWFADVMFMGALFCIGTALTFGIFMRIGSAAGALLFLMMWSVVLTPANNPLFDEHTIGMLVCILLGLYSAGRYIGLGRWWERLSFTQRSPILK